MFIEFVELPKQEPIWTSTETTDGIDAMHLLGLTDGEESWYGAEIDKTKYKIVFEDETEDSVYLKIVKKEKE